MCSYVTASLPAGTSLDVLRPLIDSFGMRFEPLSNECVQRQLPAGDHYLQATLSYCDCALVIGCLRGNERQPAVSTQEIAKQRRQGWSEAKIARWVADRTRAIERRQRRDNCEAEIRRWVDFLHALLTSALTTRVGLLIHFYDRTLATEEVRIKKRETVKLDDVDGDLLRQMQDDVLYEVMASQVSSSPRKT